MLRLLAQREQGYEDLAALMGLSVDDVRVKVNEALEALEEGEVVPPLPPEPAPPVEEPPEPEPPPVAEEPVAKPAAVESPPAPAPEEPVASKPGPKAPARPRSSAPPRLSLPSGQGARAAIAAGVAAIALVIVILAIGGGDGGDSGSDTTTAPASAAAEGASEGQSTTASSKQVTQAQLSAVDGSDASGTATFGRVKNSLALQIEVEGLTPTGKGESYTIWLADSPQKMLPLASTKVPKSGKVAQQFEVPTEVLAYLANETFDRIEVTQTSEATLEAALAKATKEKKAPAYTGTDVLSGTITGPIVGAAKKTQK
jgi:outer membrane biosynthesis protein TonB